jgi:hypothetical protein
MRAGVRACLVPACLALLGCTVQTGLPGPNVIFDTPMGPVPLNTPAPGGPGSGLAAPPPNLEPTLPAPAQAVSRDGRYAGIAQVLTTGGGLCIKPVTISGFIVRGNSARFGGFRGTIDPEGGVQMYYGGNWIVGQFEGGSFRGQLSYSARFSGNGCTYILNLERTGP